MIQEGLLDIQLSGACLLPKSPLNKDVGSILRNPNIA